MLISDAGTVIRMAAEGIKRSGRATQGVIVMRLREGEHVSSLAPVVGSDEDDTEPVKVTSGGPIIPALPGEQGLNGDHEPGADDGDELEAELEDEDEPDDDDEDEDEPDPDED